MSYSEGPWHVYYGPMESDRIFRNRKTVCAGEASKSYAVAYCDYHTPEIAEANACLIAAAPEMLEALKLARDIIGHPDDAGSKFIAYVIAKATGKS